MKKECPICRVKYEINDLAKHLREKHTIDEIIFALISKLMTVEGTMTDW